MSPYLIIIFAFNFFTNAETTNQSYTSQIDYPIEITADTIDPEAKNLPPVKEVFKVVEIMPMFPGSTEKDPEERKLRAYELQLEYIYNNLVYPEKAIEDEVEGTVVVQFNVAPDGSLQDFELLEDIGSGCGEEAIRIMKSMPKWEPGKQRGRAVLVQMKTPIFFRLASLEPKSQDEEVEFFKVVEQMPKFPGCYDGTENEKKLCASEKMLRFIYSEITYPKKARKKGIEGTVVVRYIIDRDGSIKDVECVRDIGAGCGAEAVRVVKLMPKWEAGMQKGKPVKVQFNLPVKFALTSSKK